MGTHRRAGLHTEARPRQARRRRGSLACAGEHGRSRSAMPTCMPKAQCRDIPSFPFSILLKKLHTTYMTVSTYGFTVHQYSCRYRSTAVATATPSQTSWVKRISTWYLLFSTQGYVPRAHSPETLCFSYRIVNTATKLSRRPPPSTTSCSARHLRCTVNLTSWRPNWTRKMLLLSRW